jgi:hypothetical protein
MEVSRMKFRSTLAAFAVAGATLVTAGPAAARYHIPQPPGPTLDVTMSGPGGVVWTGQCPAFIYEEKMDQLPANCRAHGSGEIHWLQSKGVTSVAKSYQGQPATSFTIAPDGKSATTVDNPGPWLLAPLAYGFTFPGPAAQTVQTCTITNGVLQDPCETNQAFKDWAAAVEAASAQYREVLSAHLPKKAHSARRR